MSTAKMQKPTSSTYSHGYKANEHCEYAKVPAFALVQFNAARIQDTHFIREDLYALAQINVAGIQDAHFLREDRYALVQLNTAGILLP